MAHSNRSLFFIQLMRTDQVPDKDKSLSDPDQDKTTTGTLIARDLDKIMAEILTTGIDMAKVSFMQGFLELQQN